MNKRSKLSVRTDYGNTFRVRAASLLSVLPPKLLTPEYTEVLDSFLEQCPDTQPVTGYTPMNDNSLLSWIRTHSMHLS